VETLVIDGDTGTQMDVPSHSVTRPELGLANSRVFGSQHIQTAPVWKFVGEACVVDVQNLLDEAPPGVSPLIGPEQVLAWETANRPLQRGDVVLFRSGYSDRDYLPMPAGRLYQADPMEGRVPAWPDPLPETMELLAGQRQVQHIGCDSPTMGPIPALAEATHFAALKYGAVFTEALTGLGQLPEQGAFYCMMGPKHRDGPYGEGRTFAIVGNPLAAHLIESARAKRVVDLSVVNSIDQPITWPGRGADRHRQPYTKNDVLWAPHLKLYHHGHTMDSGAGTHMVTPAYALPSSRLDGSNYPPGVRDWHREFEERYGALGGSDRTAEKIDLEQTCGWSRVIDVSGLVGTTGRTQWPASPQITVGVIKRYEAMTGPLRPDEIVLLRSGHTDRTFKPFGEGLACMAAPLAAIPRAGRLSARMPSGTCTPRENAASAPMVRLSGAWIKSGRSRPTGRWAAATWSG
jgi:kynurenine formamidase